MEDYDVIMEMLRRHNEGKIDLTDQEANQLAAQAKAMGERFKVESRPIAKGAFDFADMATFGLLPDQWRPTSQGQEIMGETGIDKAASTIGSLGGLVTGAAGATAAARLGWNSLKKAFTRKKANDIATNIYKGNLLPAGPNVPQLGPARPLPPRPGTPQLPSGPNIPQLGQGSPLGLPAGRPFTPTQMNLPFDPRRPIQTGLGRTGYGGTGYTGTGYGGTGYGGTGYSTSGYQEGGPVGEEWEPDMLDTVAVQAPRLSMREAGEQQRRRERMEEMQRPWGGEGGPGRKGPGGSAELSREEFHPTFGMIPRGAMELIEEERSGLAGPSQPQPTAGQSMRDEAMRTKQEWMQNKQARGY